ncbi:MAG: phosphatidylglycerophosphatase A [Candidatus Chromulinivorax sp.]|nr:phosphatidylglycerophosphatase A [Candidatus Chromulinivorax sp.]
MSKILKRIATLGPIGYLPAPGTMGTIAALPLAYGISCMPVLWQLVIIMILFGISYFVIGGALKCFQESDLSGRSRKAKTDPSQIILDEVIGTLVTFCGISYSPFIGLLGFVLFRLLDIFKPFGIHHLEKIPGSFGILIDDVAAGLLAHLILRLLLL